MGITILLIYSVLAGLFIATFFRPIFGVLGYITIYTIYNPYIWWGSTFRTFLPWPSFIAMAVLAAGSLIHLKKLKWSFSRREIELYLFLGLAWLVSYCFGIGVKEDNLAYLIKMSKMFVFLFFFIRVVNSADNFKLILWTVILNGLFLAYQAHTVSSSHFINGRLDSLGGIDFRESNAFAAFLALGMTFLGFQLLRQSWWKRVICVIGIALMVNAIIMTQSRAIFLGFLVAAPYVLFRGPKGFRIQIIIYLVLGAVLFLMLTDTKFKDRMATIDVGASHKLDQAFERLNYWKASLAIFGDYPLGIGVKNFEKVVPLYDPNNKGMDAHNTFVLCYSELGIFGVTLFLIIIGETWLQLKRIRSMIKGVDRGGEVNLYVISLETALIIYLFGYMMTHSILYTELLWILFIIPICLENAAKRLLKEKGLADKYRTTYRINQVKPPHILI